MSTKSESALSLQEEAPLARLEEFHTDAAAMRAIKEVEGAIIVAQRFKRNEDEAYQALIRSCKRSSFAERAEYKYPRGYKKDEATGKWVQNIVNGPSVYLSREAVRLWGNVQVGTEIIRDTEDERHIRSFAWDMQTNTRRFAEATFRKLIQRKVKGNDGKPVKPERTEWVRPDERDLRELSNKHAAICERNCSIQLLPYDLIQDAREQSRTTVLSETTLDPDAAKKKLLAAFDALNISVPSLELYLGHPVAECSPAEIVELRGIWASINEGNSTWADYIAEKETEADVVTPDQANEFFLACQASEHEPFSVKAWLMGRFGKKVTNGLKIPPDGFAEAMTWAKSSAKAAAAGDTKQQTQPEIISPNSDAPPLFAVDSALDAKIVQAFDILGYNNSKREKMRGEYAGKEEALYSFLSNEVDNQA